MALNVNITSSIHLLPLLSDTLSQKINTAWCQILHMETFNLPLWTAGLINIVHVWLFVQKGNRSQDVGPGG